MRILTTNLLAVALLLFGATSASAYAIDWSLRGPASSFTTSDVVIVDVFLDAEPGLTLLSVGVLYPNDGTLVYDGAAAAALAPTGPGASGAQPSYILYTPMSGAMATIMPATTLYPVATPFFNNWGGLLPPGRLQVNIDYAEGGFNPAEASGTGIYIATVLFHVTAGFDSLQLELCVTCGGNTVQIGGQTSPEIVDPSLIPLGAPIVITGHVPEPTTAALIGLGVLGLAAAGRRRA